MMHVTSPTAEDANDTVMFIEKEDDAPQNQD